MPPIIAMDPAARANLHLIDHPLVQHKLTLMRDRDASTNSFRQLLNEISSLMAYECPTSACVRQIGVLD